MKFKFHFAMNILELFTFVYLFTFSRCILLVGFVGYCLMGAKIFQALETDIQEELKNSFAAARADLRKNYANITPEELEIFLKMLIFSINHGIIPRRNVTSFLGWNFMNSFSFVATTLSTIGYGSISPRTPLGQMFFVFYAFLGIPLTVIFLKSVGNTILQSCSELGKYLQNTGMNEKQIKIYILLFFLVSGLLVFILVPPLIFMHTERWTYNEGVYFAFITLSTIGFGDYVLGLNSSQKHSPILTVLAILWCTFGLTWIALLLNLFTKVFEIMETKLTLNLLRIIKRTSPVKGLPH